MYAYRVRRDCLKGVIGTQKYVNVHEKYHFLEIQELRPLSTC